ncbi:MAG: hypothetical protein ACP5TV_07795 [Anaerolineae bacterium]
MAKEQIEKTLILLDEDEAKQALELAEKGDAQAISQFVTQVIAKKVEAALRSRCQ